MSPRLPPFLPANDFQWLSDIVPPHGRISSGLVLQQPRLIGVTWEPFLRQPLAEFRAVVKVLKGDQCEQCGSVLFQKRFPLHMQTLRKLFKLYLTENQFFTTFSNFKHGYIRKFYWSSHIFSLVLPLFHQSRTEDWQVSQSLLMGRVDRLPGWGQSDIFRTCPSDQWSDFFGRGPIFAGHRSWNVWWWFCKLRWAHDTCFSLFLISCSLKNLLLALITIKIHNYLSNKTDPNIDDHFVSVKMAPPFCDCQALHARLLISHANSIIVWGRLNPCSIHISW